MNKLRTRLKSRNKVAIPGHKLSCPRRSGAGGACSKVVLTCAPIDDGNHSLGTARYLRPATCRPRLPYWTKLQLKIESCRIRNTCAPTTCFLSVETESQNPHNYSQPHFKQPGARRTSTETRRAHHNQRPLSAGKLQKKVRARPRPAKKVLEFSNRSEN